MQNTLNERWTGFLKESETESPVVLEYDYERNRWDRERKDSLYLALIFWKFVRELIKEATKPNEVREFLKGFLSDKNSYIQTIAAFESLSDSLYQKVLWLKNIDFQTYESFLRRISKEDAQFIGTTYEEFYGGEIVKGTGKNGVPLLYELSLRCKLKYRLGFLKPETDRDGGYGKTEYVEESGHYKHSRWFTRSAWAYSLFGLDFGFSRYPKGHNNDIMISEKARRFISVKNHINDFVVDQRTGKYWLLYRTARSNYMWMPNKEVVLKSHICPGFWATFLLHFIFWIASPLLFGTALGIWLYNGAHWISWPSLALLITLFPTPLMLTFGLLKFIVRLFEKHGGYLGKKLTQAGKSVRGWYERNKDAIKEVWKIIVKALMIVWIMSFIIGDTLFFSVIWKVLTALSISTLVKIVLIGSGFVHVFYMVCDMLKGKPFHIKSKYANYKNIPAWIKRTSLFALVAALVQVYDRYAEDYVNAFVRTILSSLAEFFKFSPISGIALVAGIVLFSGTFVFLSKVQDYEEKIARVNRMLKICIGILLLFAGYIEYKAIAGLAGGNGNHALAVMASVVGALGMFGILFVLLQTVSINVKTLPYLTASRKLQITIEVIYESYLSRSTIRSIGRLGRKKLMQNQWLMDIAGQYKADEMLLELENKMGQLFLNSSGSWDNKYNAYKFLVRYVASLDATMIARFNKEVEAIQASVGRDNSTYRSYRAFIGFSTDNRWHVIDLIVLDEMTLEEAVAKAKLDITAFVRWKYKVNQNFKENVSQPVNRFFRKVARPFVRFWGFLGATFFTYKDLKKFMEEQCPQNTFSKPLED